MKKWRENHDHVVFSDSLIFFIFAAQTRNDLGRCEISFLAFLNQHSGDKENIPLDDFFTQLQDSDESDDDDSLYEVCNRFYTKTTFNSQNG